MHVAASTRSPEARRGVTVAFLATAMLAPLLQMAAQQRVVLTGATLIDGTGSAPVPGARIVIEHDRFACVSGPDGCPAQPGDRVVDLTGRWLIPGLIDTHVHLPYTEEDASRIARAQRMRFALGITTTRDAGSGAVVRLLALRDSVADAALPVPRLVVAARVSEENAEQFGIPVGDSLTRHLIALGVDAIKLKPPLENDAWRVTIRAARKHAVPVFGHTWADPPLGPFARAAAAEGVSGVSHLLGLVTEMQPPGTDLTIPAGTDAERWAWLRRLWVTVDTAMMDRLITDLVNAGTWLEPTLAHEYYWGRTIPAPAHLRFLGQPPSLRELFSRTPAVHGAVEARYPETYRRQAAFVRRFRERGGIVVAGSDGVASGLDLHEEMRLLAAATGDPMAGILAATRDAARALGREDVGTIAVGKRADAVVHETDPRGAGRTSTHIVHVIKGGVLHDRVTLFAEFRDEYSGSARQHWARRLRRWAPVLAAISVAVLAVAVTLGRRSISARRRPPGDRTPPPPPAR